MDDQPQRTVRVKTGACPVACLAFLPRLVKLAEEYGYALSVHGSLARDYDLIAVAWTHAARPAHELVLAFVEATGGFTINDVTADPYDFTRRCPEPKPHGRLAWSIHLGGGPYIDLSVIPPEPDSVSRLMDRIDEHVAQAKAAKQAEASK